MAPLPSAPQSFKGMDRVRHELLIALHFGKLNPGDQVPSVRRLADLTGINRKTVHRAYRRLAREGLLDLRPGSGTYIADTIPDRIGSASIGELLIAANRCKAQARELGIEPGTLASFLGVFLGDGLQNLRLAVAECNREQLGLIDLELRANLGVTLQPVLLDDLAAGPREALRGCWGVITTDCHKTDVTRIVAPLRLPVYRVALDPAFPTLLVRRAREAPVVMIVPDRAFVPVFRRLLQQMCDVDAKLLERFHIIQPRESRKVLESLPPETSVYVSPLLRNAKSRSLPDRFRKVQAHWRIEPASLDRLRASIAMDLVTRAQGNGNGTPS